MWSRSLRFIFLLHLSPFRFVLEIVFSLYIYWFSYCTTERYTIVVQFWRSLSFSRCLYIDFHVLPQSGMPWSFFFFVRSMFCFVCFHCFLPLFFPSFFPPFVRFFFPASFLRLIIVFSKLVRSGSPNETRFRNSKRNRFRNSKRVSFCVSPPFCLLRLPPSPPLHLSTTAPTTTSTATTATASPGTIAQPRPVHTPKHHPPHPRRTHTPHRPRAMPTQPVQQRPRLSPPNPRPEEQQHKRLRQRQWWWWWCWGWRWWWW